eukprot:gb/GEZN01005327.1/.p1 GENE.gb/GEZN01005327.1/~~gb/GEZN01005327.1/.p1  ORF type:complete len:428 (-),score=68.23 gb/GEZN01005327.1/:464-1747(-)
MDSTRSSPAHNSDVEMLVSTNRLALSADTPSDFDELGVAHFSVKENTGEKHPNVLARGWKAYCKSAAYGFFCTRWMNVLLVFLPFACISTSMGWEEPVIFFLSFVALLPLAERISHVTEDLAKYTNDTLGGLINATMGNVTEMIVSIFALKAGLVRVVQISLLGSILSNLLLVLGMAFFIGGVRHSTQTFNRRAATTNAGLLMLATLSIAFPALLDATMDDTDENNASTLVVSRLTGLLLMGVYFLLIFYQLKTHRYIFESGDDDDDDDPPTYGFWGAVMIMTILTGLVAQMSANLVNTIEDTAEDLGIPLLFIGVILLPIVGNAAEHAAAIIFAYRNKMDICIGIAVGSATQISLLVIPFCVLVGWAMGQPLSLDFQVFDTCVLLFSLLVVNTVNQHGESDWLKGVLLMVSYFVAAAAFWVKKGDM